MVETLAMLGAFALGTGVVRTWQRFMVANTVLAYQCEAMTAELAAVAGRPLPLCSRCRRQRVSSDGATVCDGCLSPVSPW